MDLFRLALPICYPMPKRPAGAFAIAVRLSVFLLAFRSAVVVGEDANNGTKVGVAGSVGFIATVNFEFSVTVGASAGGGEMSINTQGNQTCLTVTEGFQTPPGGEDVFVGYGTDLAYGVTSEVRIDSTCQAYLYPVGLVYMPIGQPRQFYYTKSEIQDQITQQQSLVDNPTLSVRARNDAQNQVDVWSKVLALNDANINNPNNVQIGAVSYGTVPSSQESSITVTETASIEYEQYVDYSASLDVVVEVGGSGVSGGYEYRGSQRYGKIENQSQEVTKIVRYTLSDDDGGDFFNVDIFRDPMFGTPVFRTAAGTKSSCPYQTGYQRDQPKLKHDGAADEHITLLGNPVGSSATFKLDLCNQSNEARSYNLKLNAQSNLNGAVVSAAGVPLNGNDLGQTFIVPANSCVQDLVVEVKQLSINSPLAYPNLELFLYAPCEENIQSSVFASVYFGNATGTDDPQGVVSQLVVSPNPASDALYLDFDMKEQAPVRFEIWDMQGNMVKTESLGVMPAGTHRQLLELGDIPNGMYVLNLQSQGGRTYRKVIVQR
ncbi:MAG TPA: T9SS type A sorting domain-containing protein [Saprospiraceae bacterium]|nr:T9SS type A sorting domain-containing protein [Saprospiraceae bacterium]